MAEKITDTGLKYEDIAAGDGPVAAAGQQVVVHYTGWLTDGSKFDSSVDRGQPFGFALGAGRVIRGWDEGVVGMQVGGKRRLTIPPHLVTELRRRPKHLVAELTKGAMHLVTEVSEGEVELGPQVPFQCLKLKGHIGPRRHIGPTHRRKMLHQRRRLLRTQRRFQPDIEIMTTLLGDSHNKNLESTKPTQPGPTKTEAPQHRG